MRRIYFRASEKTNLLYFRASEKTNFAYRGLAERQALLIERAKVTITELDTHDQVVALVGFLTFFFGFGAGAVLNLYLFAIKHPLVEQFRGALTYKSAIFGDGILLPIVNMVAVSFLLKNWEYTTKKTVQLALVLGGAITAWFHINQAVNGIVNWAMPTPWHWNILGIWHAIYMFSVASLLSLFLIVAIKIALREKEIARELIVVIVGITTFFVILRLDYMSLQLHTFFPML